MASKLEAGAALGAASIVLTGVSLLATHAPSITDVADASPGSGTAGDLHVAETATALAVVSAAGVAGLCMRQWWPLLLAVATVGTAVGVYELTLRWQRRPV